MDEALYELFLRESAAGRRREAKSAIQRFVESFTSLEEKKAWTKTFMATHRRGDRVRHELFEGVIFPALLEGYDRLDAMSIHWLAKTSHNLFSAPYMHKRLGSPPIMQLHKEAYALAPHSDEIRLGLLHALVQGLDYLTHEWPSGVLYDPKKRWETGYSDALADLKLARKLDSAGAHLSEIDNFEQILLSDYARRMNRRSDR